MGVDRKGQFYISGAGGVISVLCEGHGGARGGGDSFLQPCIQAPWCSSSKKSSSAISGRTLIYSSAASVKERNEHLKHMERKQKHDILTRNERRVENDYTLPETHIRLKRGMIISIPVYAMHRDPEWYPEPDLFRPDRFLDTDSSRPSLVHIPFRAGPRVYVGFRFVMMQVKLCLTRILLRFEATPGTTTPKHLSLIEVRNVLKINDIDILLKKRSH